MSGFELPGIGSGSAARLGAFGRRNLVGGESAPIVAAPEPAAFGGALADAIAKVDDLTKKVGDQVGDLASGQPVALHDMMMSMGKSEVSFNLMLEVRNKLVDAWEKLSRSVV